MNNKMEFHCINQSQKEIILQLIQKDLKHNQLRIGLQNLSFEDGGTHCLDMLPVITELMGVPEKEVDDRWYDIYISILGESHKFKISNSGNELKPLAEKCYEMLLSNLEIQNLLNSES